MSPRSEYSVTGNPAQIEAITHINGPAMVLAGPGSGKTFVIAGRIRFLIEEAHVDPASILVITFTKAAALEMQHRFFRDTNKRFPEVHFGTFHSVFYQMLCQSKPGFHPQILTGNEKYRIIEHSLNEVLNIHRDELSSEEGTPAICKDDCTVLLAEISKLKNMGLGPDKFDPEIPFGQFFPEVYNKYCDLCKDMGRIDFDDMILDCYNMLSSAPSILAKWQAVFSYILIDEYQDINRLQENIIRLLVSARRNIFVVGDDDQSIYGFRGSEPSIMQEFVSFYKDAKLVRLGINYRSGQRIIADSLKVIGENVNRFDKHMEAASLDHKGSVSGNVYVQAGDEISGIADSIVKRAAELFRAGDGVETAASSGYIDPAVYDNIAVLFRTNMEAEGITMELSSRGIPLVCSGALTSIYESEDIRIILSYLRFACMGYHREDFYHIINHPVRYIKRECAAYEKVRETDCLNYYRQNPGMRREIEKLFRQLHLLEHMRPALSIKYLLNEIGLEKYFLQKESGGTKSENEKTLIKQRMDTLMTDALACRDSIELLELADERTRAAVKIRQKNKNSATQHGVRIMTMHASKGLEFDTVFLPCLNEGNIPNRRSIMPAQIEEERRMLYVAMTRAKEKLILSYTKGDAQNGRMPTRFLRPIMDVFEVR